MATVEVVRTTPPPRMQRTCQQRVSRTRVACSFCGSPRETSDDQPMQPEAHQVVQHVDDGLRAASFISWQRAVAKGWSADLTTAPSSTAEEPISMSRRLQQTACRPSSVGRAECYAACNALHLMSATTSEPLSLSARPHEVCRARGWTRLAPCGKLRSSLRNLCVKGLIMINYD